MQFTDSITIKTLKHRERFYVEWQHIHHGKTFLMSSNNCLGEKLKHPLYHWCCIEACSLCRSLHCYTDWYCCTWHLWGVAQQLFYSQNNCFFFSSECINVRLSVNYICQRWVLHLQVRAENQNHTQFIFKKVIFLGHQYDSLLSLHKHTQFVRPTRHPVCLHFASALFST